MGHTEANLKTKAIRLLFVGGALIFLQALVVSPLSGASVQLNEFLASALNDTGLRDEDGQLQDWIELYNAGPDVNLEGWSLTDDPNQPQQWVFPAVTLGGGQYLVIFASGKDRRPVDGGNLHLNFKLRIDGEYLGLFNLAGDSAAVSELSPGFPVQRANYSYARDNTGKWVYFQKPTPGGPNGTSGITEVVAPVHFNVNSGTFRNAFNLVLTTPTGGALIRYTTDGSPPTDSSGALYTAPIPIGATAIVRAAAFKPNALPSAVETRTFLFKTTAAIESLPILSIVLNPPDLTGRWGIQGIQGGTYDPIDCCFSNWRRTRSTDYFNPAEGGVAWERAVNLELLEAPGEDGFSTPAGIRIHGSESSRMTYHPDSKFSYNIFFRGDYGAGKLHYPLMPASRVTTFDSLVLRAGHNDMVNPFITDELVRRLLADTGQVSSHGTFVNLFVNGEYRGYYNPAERIDADWVQLWQGGGSSWDVIQPYSAAQDGDNIDWYNLLNFANSHDLNATANYQVMEGRLDLVNFVDYLLVNIYAATRDWTQNNWRAARERVSGARWRFYVWDAEQSMGLGGLPVDYSVLSDPAELANTDPDIDLTQIPLLLRRLKASREFKLLFADRIQKHFYNNGALTGAHVIERFNELRKVLAGVLPGMEDYILTDWAPQRSDVVLRQLSSAGLNPSVAAPSFNQSGGNVPNGFALTMNAPAGKIYFTVDGSDPRVKYTAAVSPGASVFFAGASVPLTQSTVVKARVLSGTTWSGLTEAEFKVAELGTSLRITEIMYNPPGGDAYEFIEIYNSANRRLDVSGTTIDGISFVFPPGAALEPGAVIVLASGLNPTAFAARYPGVPIYGTFGGNLSNGGERIAIKNRDGQTIYALSYDDENGWPKAADGGGYSLENITINGNPSDPSSWRASPTANGSPGTLSATPPLPPIRFNEVMADNVSAVANGAAFPDWIELYNPGASAVDLSGWSLTDDGNARKFVFPTGTELGPDAYLIVWCDTQFGDPGLHAGFALDRQGKSLFLYDAPGNRIDAMSYGQQVADYSVGLVDSTWQLTKPTLGQPNVASTRGGAGALIINEWMANSTPGASDWLELYNQDSAYPVALRGIYLTTSNAVFQVQSLSFIGPHQHMVLWADEKSGPNHLEFKLSASGDTVNLYDGGGGLVDSITYGPQTEGVSQGLAPDGVKNITSFNVPTPGASNVPPAYNGPFINELLIRGQDTSYFGYPLGPQWVEISNPTADWLDATGMSLSTDPTKPNQWIFPPGSRIGPTGMWLIGFDTTRPSFYDPLYPIKNFSHALSGYGGGLYLFNRAGQLVDKVEFGFQLQNHSIGRTANGWALLEVPTPAEPNSAPAALGPVNTVRLNEWMANPTRGDDWLELYNSGALPVSLEGLLLTDDPSIAGEIKYRIGPLSFIDSRSWVQFTADGNPKKGPSHLSFSLDSLGESLRLYDSNHAIIDSVDFALETPGFSQGRFPDGQSNIITSSTPTPGEPNSPDSDGDGIPDVWESANHLDPNNPVDAQGDADNDGTTNFAEYVCGTDPRDPRSCLKFDSVTQSSGNVILVFRAAANRSYSILYSSSLTVGSWVKMSNVGAEPEARQVGLTDSVPPGAGPRFYQIVAPALP
jgi:hypothetical protein